MKEDIIYNGVTFDSQQELDFYWFLQAMHIPFTYHPESIVLTEPVTETIQIPLKTKVKEKQHTILRGSVYTADFIIKAVDVPAYLIEQLHWRVSPDCNYWIDVKGGNFIGGKCRAARGADAVKFSLIQKFVYYRYGIFVNKVVPAQVFNLIGVPTKCRYTKTGKLKKAYINCKEIGND